MTLSRASWWPAAEGLKLGQKVRRPHECGEGRVLILSRDERGYRAWCHRCNDGDRVAPPVESLADKLARLAALSRGDASLAQPELAHSLPVPQVHEVSQWPDGAALWLYKAGLGKAEIARLGVYYHPPSDRVVLPVYEAGLPVYWQARAYQPGRFPKYLGPTPRPPHLLPRWGSFVVPTLTEDILSAMKVGLVAEGIAVLGTRVPDSMVSRLMKIGKCNVALDPDPAGRRGAAKICKQLRAYGVGVRDVVMPKDPKLMPRDYLRRVLVEGLDPSEAA